MKSTEYCSSITEYSRLVTKEVFIGDIPLGNSHPLRIQSMTNTDSAEVEKTIEQCIKIFDAGADYVRITVPSLNDAILLGEIRKELKKRGYSRSLIADVHFNPKVAEKVASVVEKVRINPGNYADSKKFEKHDYSDDGYLEKLHQVKARFVPLLNICKEHHTTLRIGVNHGSLSDRIMSRYGDTPAGMTESAMEFIRFCNEESFSQVVISIKASNTIIMVQAMRMLVNRMIQENLVFPLHLGVTEAGEGEDGRIKSAVGIGALLIDGIGDTIRVSLTEDPEREIPVAKKLADCIPEWESLKQVNPPVSYPLNPFEYRRRSTYLAGLAGNGQPPVVIADLSLKKTGDTKDLKTIDWYYDQQQKNWKFSDQAADYVFLGNLSLDLDIVIPPDKTAIADFSSWKKHANLPANIVPLLNTDEYLELRSIPCDLYFIQANYNDLNNRLIEKLRAEQNGILVIQCDPDYGFYGQRAFVFGLMNAGCTNPVIFRNDYAEKDRGDFQLKSAANTGSLFIDGLGDGIWLTNTVDLGTEFINSTAFGILQASRARISKTEYISCPSCGRTWFNLMEATRKIRERTSHLKGLKIGIMGCIVNGIGEMADADYGYVGAGRGKITLYKGKQVIKRNISESNAVDELIDLIKENGDWINPEKDS